VKALGVDCISSVGDCDYGTVFDTGIVVEFDGIASEISDQRFLLGIRECFVREH
jgi:hypothetical protein